ncbi:MAG: class I SAM-dependent methyltransferase [Magnetospirillum sp.]|nr:class I SAM-dependent methyltransferase [Magnetospirillum sp.]
MMMTDPPGLFSRLHGLDWYGGMLRRWTEGLGLRPEQRVLELGCGPGCLSRDLAARGMRVTGMDCSSRMIRHAAGAARSEATFQVAALPLLPVDDGTYDVVLAASLLNVIKDKPAAIAEMTRVVRSGGLVSALFPVPGFEQAANRLARQMSGFSRAAMRQWGRSGAPLNPDAVCDWFGVAGLAPLSISGALEGGIAIVTGRKL